MAMRQLIARFTGMNCGFRRSVPHLHKRNADYSNHHEARKGQQKHAPYGENCGREHHQEGDHRQEVIIALAPAENKRTTSAKITRCMVAFRKPPEMKK